MQTIYVKLQNFHAHTHRFVLKKTLLLSKKTNNFLMTYDGYGYSSVIKMILKRSTHFSEHWVFFDRFPLFDVMLQDFKLVRRNNISCDAINRRAFHKFNWQNYNESNLYALCHEEQSMVNPNLTLGMKSTAVHQRRIFGIMIHLNRFTNEISCVLQFR